MTTRSSRSVGDTMISNGKAVSKPKEYSVSCHHKNCIFHIKKVAHQLHKFQYSYSLSYGTLPKHHFILMQRLRLFICLVAIATTVGCTTSSSNMRIGTDRSLVSLGDQRQAILTVSELISVPDGAKVLGKVDASRCHRRTDQTEPTEQDVKVDLKIAAYAFGADAIAGVKIDKVSGLAQNCWYILSGEASAVSMRK
jgi:hypothetical protein